MSEIKNVGLTWMALNTSKCNHLMPLCFKGLMSCGVSVADMQLLVETDKTKKQMLADQLSAVEVSVYQH